MKNLEDEIHIYQYSLEITPHELNKFQSILSNDELEKANRFRFEKDKVYYTAGRGILRNILSEYLNVQPEEITFSYSEKGKPYLNNDSNLKFNLAHSAGRAVYAICLNDEVGIDIEYLRDLPDAVEIAKRFFADEEIEVFMNVDYENIQAAFFNCWTRKEAFIKSIGEGLSYPLKNFSVSLKPGDKPRIFYIKDAPDEPDEWSLYNIETEENFISSLAIRAKEKKIVIKNSKL